LGVLLSEGQQRRHTGRGQAQPAIAQMTDRSVGSVNAMRTEIPPDSTCDSWVSAGLCNRAGASMRSRRRRWGMAAQMRQGDGVTWLAVVHWMVDGGRPRRRITL